MRYDNREQTVPVSRGITMLAVKCGWAKINMWRNQRGTS